MGSVMAHAAANKIIALTIRHYLTKGYLLIRHYLVSLM